MTVVKNNGVDPMNPDPEQDVPVSPTSDVGEFNLQGKTPGLFPQIRQRIRSVRNISQMLPLETIAAARIRPLRLAQQSTLASRNFSEKAREVMQFVVTEPDAAKNSHPLLEDAWRSMRLQWCCTVPTVDW